MIFCLEFNIPTEVTINLLKNLGIRALATSMMEVKIHLRALKSLKLKQLD